MKRLLPLLLLAASAISVQAQTISFSVPVTPCHNDGVLTANFTGFTPPLTVEWHTEGTMGSTIIHTATGMSDGLTGYSGGPVSITVSDGTSLASNTFPGMPPLTYTLTTTTAICPALGTIDGVATGGTAPYTYQWFDKSTGSIVASGTPASLPAGNYGVVVTDAAGCAYGSRHRNDSNRIMYTSFTATVTATPANCTDGTASVSAVSSSAVLPYSYHWNTGATTPTISGLSRGTYAVDIIDAMGCMATADTGMPYTPYSVYVPQTTVISIPSTITPATCLTSDGAIGTFASGGTAPYTYNWSDGATTAARTGLLAGTYHLTVTDASGCYDEANFYVAAGTPITVTSSSSPSLCTSPTGNASIVLAGGTAPYATTWYTTPAQTSTTATLLAPGTYNFRVTDAAGCVQTGSVAVAPVNVVYGTFTSSSPLCTMSNGSIAVTPTGGAAPYTYLWSNGATSTSISSLPAGGYSVRITDAMGCKRTLGFNLASFSPVGAGLSVTDASCILAADGSITATAYGGTAPYTYGWSTGGSGATISGLNSRLYSVNVTDATGCTATRTAHVGYNAANTSCYCTIEGTIYADTNSNCIQDVGETGIPHIQVYCSGIGYTYTNAAGHYSFIVPSGSYTVTETVQSFYPLSPCQVNGIPVTATAATGCVHTVDFANAPATVHNLRLSAATLVPPVPGNVYKQIINIVNEGTVSEDSAQTSHRPDGQLFAPSFVPSGIFGGSPYLYTTTALPALAPGNTHSFIVSYNVPTNIPVATAVTFRDTVGWNDSVSTWVDDHTPANNVVNQTAVVVASYDPNFKEVTPRGTGSNGIIYAATDTVLEYSVHFQNTGTWYAQNIVVLDTLDANLDWTSLHPVYESAPCKVSMYAAGTLRVARFEFSNINLPPAMFDDLRSNGMFTYTMRLMPGLTPGTQIRNSASIYFDYNAPILTNSTLNTIGSTGTTTVRSSSEPASIANVLKVYPNPAGSQFHAVMNMEKAGPAFMTITDMTGKTVVTRTLALVAGAQTITTDISNYAPGIYFVNVNTNGAVYTQKLVVIK